MVQVFVARLNIGAADAHHQRVGELATLSVRKRTLGDCVFYLLVNNGMFFFQIPALLLSRKGVRVVKRLPVTKVTVQDVIFLYLDKCWKINLRLLCVTQGLVFSDFSGLNKRICWLAYLLFLTQDNIHETVAIESITADCSSYRFTYRIGAHQASEHATET